MTNEELVLRYQEGLETSFDCLDELVEANKGLVIFFARKYAGFSNNVLAVKDLIQEGWIGFLNAVEKYKFNEDNPVKFSTYAGKAITRQMFRAIDKNSPRIKKSDRETKVNLRSLSEIIPGTDDFKVVDTIIDVSTINSFEIMEKEFDNEILRKDIFEMLEIIFPDDIKRDIIIEYYGLEAKPMTLAEMGKKYKLSIERIRQLEREAIRTIRKTKVGQAFMAKYGGEQIRELKQKRSSINQFNSPEKVLCQIETIDELLDNILKRKVS